MRYRDYDYYEPDITDYGERVDTPDYVIETALDSLEKEVKPILRKITQFFKAMGWRVTVNHYDSGFDDALTTTYEIDLIVKGGQKLVLDRKQWVSDGTYRPNIIISFYSEEADEIEQGDDLEYQIDVDEFKRIPAYYTMPNSDFEYFTFIDGDVSNRLMNNEYSNREVEKACREWVLWYLSKGSRSRSKWKSRRAMIATVADRYLGEKNV